MTVRGFSIVIPTYNRAQLLLRAVNSVLDQAYATWELIIVDDCSIDNTEAVITPLLKDPRISFCRLKTNSGAAAARNEGIRLARYEFVSLLDSDDVYHREFLLRTKDVIESHPSCGFTYCGVGDIAMDRGGVPKENKVWKINKELMSKKKPYLYDLKLGTAAGITIRKEVFDRVGYFDQSLKAAEDTEFFIRASEFFTGCPIPFTLIFKDNESSHRLTLNFEKNSDAYRAIIARNYNDITGDVMLVKRWFYKSLWLNLYAGRKNQALEDYNTLREHKALSLKITLLFKCGLIMPRMMFISLHKFLGGRMKR